MQKKPTTRALLSLELLHRPIDRLKHEDQGCSSETCEKSQHLTIHFTNRFGIYHLDINPQNDSTLLEGLGDTQTQLTDQLEASWAWSKPHFTFVTGLPFEANEALHSLIHDLYLNGLSSKDQDLEVTLQPSKVNRSMVSSLRRLDHRSAYFYQNVLPEKQQGSALPEQTIAELEALFEDHETSMSFEDFWARAQPLLAAA